MRKNSKHEISKKKNKTTRKSRRKTIRKKSKLSKNSRRKTIRKKSKLSKNSRRKTSRKSKHKTCPSGKIRRKSYRRRGSKGSIKKYYVSSSCIKDRGKKGKGPETLPPISKKMSLSKFGYKLKKSHKKRKKSINKASKKYGTLSVLRRINLIRNYSESEEDNYKKLSKDVEYVKKKYKKEKK